MQFYSRHSGIRTSKFVQRKGGVRDVNPVCCKEGIQGWSEHRRKLENYQLRITQWASEPSGEMEGDGRELRVDVAQQM